MSNRAIVKNNSTSWKIWTLNNFGQILHSSFWIVDKKDNCIYKLI